MPARSSRIKKQQSPKRCKHCTNKAKSRGLCDTCRISMFGKINRGEFTEQHAIDQGWIDTAKTRGRKPTSGFAKKFQAMKKAQ